MSNSDEKWFDWERKAIRCAPGTKTKYPYGQIEVGETFLIPVEDGDTVELLERRIRPGASRYGLRNGVRLSVNVERAPVPGVRVGRTA